MPEPDAVKPARSLLLPAAGTAITASVIVLLVELARTGALEQYKDLITPIIGWGPGLVIFLGCLWIAHTYAPPAIAAHNTMSVALQRLADTMDRQGTQQQDIVLATQVNSDKIDHINALLTEMKQAMERRRETDAR